ncbi:hypothetical protein SBOR_3787 [Sclerotinia borealis F-4128]|uniref:Delta(24)-sterol reductase n=1 Tax=Sclerotinia borealis (strain F-4128) TaxID=1432307 RepID=W9CMY0_SCLBF|nr:hypothetical protein SBOR_3787 [Sclerotinia borealis F-4128]
MSGVGDEDRAMSGVGEGDSDSVSKVRQEKRHFTSLTTEQLLENLKKLSGPGAEDERKRRIIVYTQKEKNRRQEAKDQARNKEKQAIKERNRRQEAKNQARNAEKRVRREMQQRRELENQARKKMNQIQMAEDQARWAARDTQYIVMGISNPAEMKQIIKREAREEADLDMLEPREEVESATSQRFDLAELSGQRLSGTTKLKQFFERREAFRVYHGSTNSTRGSNRRRDRMIDTSRLDRVLKVDTEKRTALVEPNVPMDRLVAETLRYGLVPPVVMEFPGITAGGGFAGTSGESSSFKYGFFDCTVNWIEMVLANGDIVMASKNEESDLFYGAASSFGTLGGTTLIELQLIEAKTYVELTYINIRSMAEGIQKIEEITKDPSVDYLDGILFSKKAGVICSGRLVNTLEPNTQIQGFVKSSDPWFYLHAMKIHDRSSGSVTEAIPLVDYLFRESPLGLLAERKENSSTPDMLLNFGAWGPGPDGRDAFISWNRRFEQKVRELGGQKWLYAHAYYTEKEFDEIYNRKEYDALRVKYHATYLPSIYDKVKVDIELEHRELQASWSLWLLAIFWNIWPLSGLYGVLQAFLGGYYLLPKTQVSSKIRSLKDRVN